MSIKISELPSASYIGSEDYIPIVQNGTTKKGTANMLNNDEYTKLEYIESTGTQYIDTGVTPTQYTKIEVDFELTTTTQQTYTALFGTQNADSGYPGCLFFCGSTYTIRFGTQQLNTTSGININTNRHTAEISFNNFIFDNVTYTGTNTFTTAIANPIYIFCRNSGGSPFSNSYAKAKIYSFKLYDNGTLVRDFIPVLKNTTGEAGLLDKVNGVFYGNSGTGSFSFGRNEEIYTTSEQRIGTWIDGKPLYRKVISKEAPTVTTDGTFANNYYRLEYVDFLAIENMFAMKSELGNSAYPIPYSTNSGYILKSSIYKNGGQYVGRVDVNFVSNGTSFNGYTCYAIVIYTKTTDTATRGVVEQTRGLTKGGIDEDNMITPIEQPEEEKKEEEPIEKKSEEVVKENNEVSGEELKELGDEPVDEQTK